MRDDEGTHRDQPQVAVVDAHDEDHDDGTQYAPQRLRADDREGILVEQRVCARARVDHQDAEGGQRHDREEQHPVRFVAFALRTAQHGAAAGPRVSGFAAFACCFVAVFRPITTCPPPLPLPRCGPRLP